MYIIYYYMYWWFDKSQSLLYLLIIYQSVQFNLYVNAHYICATTRKAKKSLTVIDKPQGLDTTVVNRSFYLQYIYIIFASRQSNHYSRPLI